MALLVDMISEDFKGTWVVVFFWGGGGGGGGVLVITVQTN